MTDNPNIHPDDAWKQEAQREKDRLEGKPQTPPPASQAPPPPPAAKEPPQKPPASEHMSFPPASFALLLEEFITRAYLYLGLIPHPGTGKRDKNLDLARHSIDMLGIIQEKTKGNLTAEEDRALTTALYELRMAYVKVTKP